MTTERFEATVDGIVAALRDAGADPADASYVLSALAWRVAAEVAVRGPRSTAVVGTLVRAIAVHRFLSQRNRSENRPS